MLTLFLREMSEADFASKCMATGPVQNTACSCSPSDEALEVAIAPIPTPLSYFGTSYSRNWPTSSWVDATSGAATASSGVFVKSYSNNSSTVSRPLLI